MSKKQLKFETKIIRFLRKKKKPASIQEIKRRLNINKKSFDNFNNAIQNLVSSRRIIKDKMNQKYAVLARDRTVTGELRITRGGFGFVKDEEMGVDVFIGRDHLNTAFDRDIVKVKLYAKNRGKNEDGFVTDIIKRNKKKFVGTFHLSKYYGYVVPDDTRVYRDFFIPKEKQGDAKNGQKVVVSLEKWDTDHLNPEASITEVLGYPGDLGVDVASVAHSFQINMKFSSAVEHESSMISGEITAAEIGRRVDLRNTPCFTIDPKEAKDFDDAISLKRLANGNYELGVHIADVSHYVPQDSALDKEAFKRGTSVYLVDRVIPMLPEKLSNEICSLQPDKEKLTYSCIMEINKDADIINYKITPSVIKSRKRYTYEEVQELVGTAQTDSFTEILRDMMSLSKKLTDKRLTEGGIDFETPEVTFELNENGFPIRINRRERLNSHRLVEEFMLLANKTVAKHVQGLNPGDASNPFVFRVHEKPDSEKMEKFYEFLTALNIRFKPVKKVTAHYFQNLLNKIKGTKEEMLIEEVALRSMMKAIYSTKNVEHFGLGFKDYTHFTSPIRRYPDLIVHRLLRRYTVGKKNSVKNLTQRLNKICDQATKMERLAQEAERESIRLKQNEYISQHIGDQYDGIISGVMSFGIFVELVDSLVEGLVHVRDMDDYYIFDEKIYRLIGKDTGRELRLGDEIRIVVKDVNLEEGKVDFILADNVK